MRSSECGARSENQEAPFPAPHHPVFRNLHSLDRFWETAYAEMGI